MCWAGVGSEKVQYRQDPGRIKQNAKLIHAGYDYKNRDTDMDVDMGRFLQLNFRGFTIQDLIVT
jgi:hypothetical protein